MQSRTDLRHTTTELPSALDRLPEIRSRAEGKRLALFLDYDGTLTPIVERPELARLAETMRAAVSRLSRIVPVAIVSGRDLRDVKGLVGLDEIYYAGSHGFEMEGPGGERLDEDPGSAFLPALDSAEHELRSLIAGVEGALVERKRFSIAAHYRQVSASDIERVEHAVERTAARHQNLRRAAGKKVHELQPAIEWHKGKAVLRLLELWSGGGPELLPAYLGDDVTDENAFEALGPGGVGIIVRDEPRLTAATYHLNNTDEVREFLEKIA